MFGKLVRAFGNGALHMNRDGYQSQWARGLGHPLREADVAQHPFLGDAS